MKIDTILQGDALTFLQEMPSDFANCIITSPPYNKALSNSRRHLTNNPAWKSPNNAIDYDLFDDDMPEEEYQEEQIKVINECIRILKPLGSFFYNHKNRIVDMRIINPMEWILKTNATVKQEIIWDRLGQMVQIDKVRFFPTTEKIFWLIKSQIQPYFNPDMAYLTDIWRIQPVQGDKRRDHPAPFPEKLAANCILATTQKGDLVLDPYSGSATVAVVAKRYGRNFIGIELNPKYIECGKKRINAETAQIKMNF